MRVKHRMAAEITRKKDRVLQLAAIHRAAKQLQRLVKPTH